MLEFLVDLGPMGSLAEAHRAVADRVARIFGRRRTQRLEPSDRLKALSQRRLGVVRFSGRQP